jgi:hypothetical protein
VPAWLNQWPRSSASIAATRTANASTITA